MDSTDAAACWEGNAETWTQHARAGYDLYRDALNTPVFFASLPQIAGCTASTSAAARAATPASSPRPARR